MVFKLNANGTIDATDPNNLSDRVASEQETRKKFLSYARAMGFEREMLLLFAKYDKMMRTCSNDKERADIAKLGAFEVYKLLGGGGEFYVNGQLVYREPSYTPPEKGNKNE